MSRKGTTGSKGIDTGSVEVSGCKWTEISTTWCLQGVHLSLVLNMQPDKRCDV